MANNKTIIQTDNAPAAIGAYSQAARAGNLLFVSGQIPLCPQSGGVVEGDADARIRQVFSNFAAVCKAAGAEADDAVKLTVYLTDLSLFARVNEIMAEYFTQPYPARAAVGVAELPKGVDVEVEGVVAVQ